MCWTAAAVLTFRKKICKHNRLKVRSQGWTFGILKMKLNKVDSEIMPRSVCCVCSAHQKRARWSEYFTKDYINLLSIWQQHKSPPTLHEQTWDPEVTLRPLSALICDFFSSASVTRGRCCFAPSDPEGQTPAFSAFTNITTLTSYLAESIHSKPPHHSNI